MRRVNGPVPLVEQRRRRHAVRRAMAVVRAGALAAGLVAAVAAPLWLWRSGTVAHWAAAASDAMIGASASWGLRVENVFVAGRNHTEPADLLAALGVRAGDPMLAIDPESARARLEALPWVRYASVERHLPDTIRIEIDERRPIALWQHEGRLALIDGDGAVIGDDVPQAYRGLPMVVGPDAPAHTRALFRLLAGAPDLAERVAVAIRVGGRRWNLRLDDRVSVSLPETNAEAAWRRLAEIERRERLVERGVVSIDMRFPDRLVIRRAPDGDPIDNEIGKET